MSQEILVVGAGVIGCTLARTLTDRGCAVTVLDLGEAGHRTSETSFAWVNSNGKEPDAYGELNFLGLQAHRRWSASGDRGWFHQIGNLRISTSDAVQAGLEAEVERQHRFGAEARMINRRELAELEPAIRAGDALGAAYFPQEGWVDTFTMCSSLLHDAIAAGARFLPFRRVTRLTDSGVLVVDPDGEQREIPADTVILAAGNGTREILAADDIDFPTLPISTELSLSGDAVEHPTVGLTCTTTPVAGRTVRHLVHADEIALRPSAGGGLTLTDHPTASRWDSTDPDLWQVPQLLLDRARRICPTLQQASIETVALGNRILPADGVTIADWVTADRRVYAVATHSGVTLCAHLAEAVSAEVVDGERDPSLTSFGLDRFAPS